MKTYFATQLHDHEATARAFMPNSSRPVPVYLVADLKQDVRDGRCGCVWSGDALATVCVAHLEAVRAFDATAHPMNTPESEGAKCGYASYRNHTCALPRGHAGDHNSRADGTGSFWGTDDDDLPLAGAEQVTDERLGELREVAQHRREYDYQGPWTDFIAVCDELQRLRSQPGEREAFDPVWHSMLYTAADNAAPVHRGAILRAYEYIKRSMARERE